MQIGELAKKAHTEVETIRFYEREGVLSAPERTASGYRRYEESHLHELSFILHCRSLGLSLLEIKLLANYKSHPDAQCDQINQLIDSHIQKVHSQIASLRRLEKQLSALRHRCQLPSSSSECGILQSLCAAAVGESCACHAVKTEAIQKYRSLDIKKES